MKAGKWCTMGGRQFLLSIVCALLLTVFCPAQQSKIDSLLFLLKHDKEDTTKVLHLNLLSRQLSGGNLDTSILLSKEALKLSEAQGWKKGIASSSLWLGWCSYLRGEYPQALAFDFAALQAGEETGNQKVISSAYGSIGNIYSIQRDYSKALDYFFKALKIDEGLGDKRGMARHLVNIGVVYDEQKAFSKALEYYFMALKMNEELNDKNATAAVLGNIGSAYGQQANLPASDMDNGKLLHEKALEYYFKALKIGQEIENRNGIAITLGNIGSVYIDIKKYSEAAKYLLEALNVAKEIGAVSEEMQFEELLSNLYSKTNRFTLALEHYKRSIALKDTLFNEEKNEELTRREMSYEFEKKEAAARAENEKKVAVAEAEKQRQRIVLILVSCVLLLMIVFAGLIFRSLRTTRRQKQLIEGQKHLVEEKQKEILDSIRYAKRIQTALLPTEKYVARSLDRLMKKY